MQKTIRNKNTGCPRIDLCILRRTEIRLIVRESFSGKINFAVTGHEHCHIIFSLYQQAINMRLIITAFNISVIQSILTTTIFYSRQRSEGSKRGLHSVGID